MNSELGIKLDRICRRHRNRLWLNRVLRRAVPALWYCAAVFFLAGVAHQQLMPLNFPLAAGIAILPALLYIGYIGFSRMPSLQEGAAAADERLGANSLFVSAWELCPSARGNRGTGKLLLERCAAALPEWSESPRDRSRGTLNPAGLIAVTLAITGLFLLLQPAKVGPRQTAATAPRAEPESVGEVAANAAEILRQLRETDPRPASPAPARRIDAAQAEDSAGPGSPPRPLSIERTAHSARTEALPTTAARTSSTGEEPAAAAHIDAAAGDAAGGVKIADRNAGDEAGETAATGAIEAGGFDRTRRVDIDTGSANGATAASGADAGAGLIEAQAQEAAARGTADPGARQLAPGGFALLLSAQQRSLVSRYFTHLDGADGAHE